MNKKGHFISGANFHRKRNNRNNGQVEDTQIKLRDENEGKQLRKSNKRRQKEEDVVEARSVKTTKEKDDKTKAIEIKSQKENDKEITRRREKIQTERIEHFRKQCHSYHLDSNSNGDEGLKVLYSKKYKLAYRLVPKVGSTFMIQVYSILKDYGNTKKVLNLSRGDIHNGRADNFRKIMPLKSLKDYTVLIMARNPYSRLYSAYVDKIYILNTFSLCKDVISKLFGTNAQKNNCKFDISFEQFLEYYLEKGGHSEEGHYGPIVSKTIGKKICNLENIIIVKQETFSDDVDHAFKTVHVKGREYNAIYDSLNSKNTETNIASIVKTVYNKFSSYIQRGSCLTWKNIAKKLWKSFQIQGYIRDRSNFPETKYENSDDYKSAEYLIKVIMQEVDAKPLTHQEKMEQRNNALMKAYSGVNKKYLREIQDRYAMDFNLFQYGTNLKDALS
jgi:hypothetical protein